MPDYTPLPAETWLREHWQRVEEYNFQWVAVNSHDLIGHSSDLDRLMDMVEERGLTEDALYVFVEYPQVIRGEGR